MRRENDTPYQKIHSVPPAPPEYVPEQPDPAEVAMLEALEIMKGLGPKTEEESQ